jgi:8-oxo-dGTP diphosphatase
VPTAQAKHLTDAKLGDKAPAGGKAASFIDKLALVLVRDRKQLVARTAGKTAFFTPGGKREAGESDVQALVRECKEELTVDLAAETIKPYGVFQAQAFGKPEGTMVRMTCYTADFAGTLTANEEIEELVRALPDLPQQHFRRLASATWIQRHSLSCPVGVGAALDHERLSGVRSDGDRSDDPC